MSRKHEHGRSNPYDTTFCANGGAVREASSLVEAQRSGEYIGVMYPLTFTMSDVQWSMSQDLVAAKTNALYVSKVVELQRLML